MLGSTAKATKAAKASAVSPEDISEHGEDVVHRETAAEAASTAETTTGGIEAKLVVLLALLWVVQYIVCLGSFLEFLFSLGIAGVSIGVIFDSQLTVSYLYFVFCSGLVYA